MRLRVSSLAAFFACAGAFAVAACSSGNAPSTAEPADASTTLPDALATDSGTGVDASAPPDAAIALDGAPGPSEAGTPDAGQDAGAQLTIDDTPVAVYVNACARLPGGQLKCWGGGNYGIIGLGDTKDRGAAPNQMGSNLPPIDLGSGRTVMRVSGGPGIHVCALLDNAQVKCWGFNEQGQLGLGDQVDRGDKPNQMGDNLPPIDLGTGNSAVEVAAGSAHNCARLYDGRVKCWGKNISGQLGIGSSTLYRGTTPNSMGDTLPSVNLGPGRTARQIATGQDFSCALLDNAQVKCWGANTWGQLGLGDTAERGRAPGELGSALPAVDFGAGRQAVQISAGSNHACAVLDNGSLTCWGWNAMGQLGLGIGVETWGTSPTHFGANARFVDVGVGRTAKRVVAAQHSTCAFLDNDQLKCWGSNESFRLGNGDNVERGKLPSQMGNNLPALDPGPGDTFTGISIANGFGCGRLKSGQVKCWGASNQQGKLGSGSPGGLVQVGAALPAVQL